MGKVDSPQKPPASVDYDLWSGPAPKELVKRMRFHYDWHWQWLYGGGEAANNGPHTLDECRWAIGHKALPPRVFSLGGRFGYDDDGETPNTLITVFDYDEAPIYFEVRGLPRRKGDSLMDANHMRSASGKLIQVGEEHEGTNNGSVIICEHGYMSGAAVYDNDGKLIQTFQNDQALKRSYFPNAMRSRKRSDMRVDILEGHLSTSLCHLANISYLVGQEASVGEIKEKIQDSSIAVDRFKRFQNHLKANGVNVKKTRAVLGPWLEFDPSTERFTGGADFEKANALLTRKYREPFVVPEKV
jgi:hypothetical protein